MMPSSVRHQSIDVPKSNLIGGLNAPILSSQSQLKSSQFLNTPNYYPSDNRIDLKTSIHQPNGNLLYPGNLNTTSNNITVSGRAYAGNGTPVGGLMNNYRQHIVTSTIPLKTSSIPLTHSTINHHSNNSNNFLTDFNSRLNGLIR